MGKTVEELNFKLILDDKDFDGKVTKAKKEAADLNIQLSKLLEIKKNAGTLSAKEYQTLKRLDNLESNRRINAEKEATAVARRVAVEQRITQEKERQTTAMASQSRMMGDLTSLATQYLSIWGAGKLLKELVNVTGEFEMQRTTLRAMLQDAQGADAIYEQIKSLAVVSPFSFKELVTYTKQLAAYSVPIGELYDTTKMLADVSAGIGVSMDRLVLAYGQVRSAAFLRGQEVRQFTEAGIPILDMLAKQFEEIEGRIISTGEVFDRISKRQVPFEMVARAFQEMTSEGGKFYNMQEIQADTLKGKISNLKDAYEIMFSEMGERMMPALKGGVDAIRNLAVNYERIGRGIVELVAAYGIYQATLITTEAITNSFTLANHKLINSFVTLAKRIGTAVMANPYALVAAGATAAAFAVYKLADAWLGASEMMKDYQREAQRYRSDVASETAALDTLYAKLRVAKEGTEEYESAKRTIYSKYGEYITALRKEGIEVSNLAGIYEQLKTKVLEASRAKFVSSAMQSADEDLAKETDRIYKSFVRKFKKGQVGGIKGLSEATAVQKEAVWSWITGSMDSYEVEEYIPKAWKGFFAWMKKDFTQAANEYSRILGDIGKVQKEFLKDAGVVENNTETPDPTDPKDDWRKKKIADVQEQIRTLEKLRDVYEKLKPYYSNTEIADFFSKNFGFVPEGMRDGFDFDDKILELVASLETLGTDGIAAANKFKEGMGISLAGDMVKAQKDAENAKKAFDDLMDSLIVGSEDIEGEGVSYRISKIVADYQGALDQISNKAQEAREKLDEKATKEKAVAGLFSQEEFDKANEEIDNYVKTANGNALVKYSEEGRKAIAQLYKEWRDGNLDFNNLSDKTIGQLKSMRDAISSLDTSMLPDEAVANLRSLGISLEDIERAIAALTNGDLDKLNDEIKDNTWERTGKIADYTKQAAGALREYAEAAGNDDLASLMEGVEGLADIVSNVSERLAKGDIAGAVVAGVSTLFQQVMKAATAAAELRNAIAETRMEAERLNAEAKLSEGIETLFGDSTLQRIRNAVNLMKEYQSVVNNDKAGADRSITWRSGLFNWGRRSKDLDEMMTELGYDLYDVYGNLNAAGLQAILDTYENLTTADRKWIEEAIKNAELYGEAMESLDDVIKDTFSDIAENMADKLINARLEIGDAYEALAGDLQDVFGDTADTIARQLVKSFIVENILNSYSDDLRNLYGMMARGDSEADIANAYATMVNSVIEDSEIAAEFTNRLYDALEQAGINLGGSDAVGNLADGIKGMTEDEANLIASYLNAIRADVSYAKVQRDEILKRLDVMSGFVSAPTLTDYLNQIQANTFNTAEHTRQMLADIQSMMTTEGGFTALRVYS